MSQPASSSTPNEDMAEQAVSSSASDEDMGEHSTSPSTSDEDMADLPIYEPQFPDQPFDFVNLTQAQYTLADELHQLTQIRIDHFLTLSGTPGDPPNSDSDSSASNSDPDFDDPPITSTESATIAHLCTLTLPIATPAQMLEILDRSNGLLNAMFGYFLARLCGEQTAWAFFHTEQDWQQLVFELTERYGVRALGHWQRGAEAGGWEGLVREVRREWDGSDDDWEDGEEEQDDEGNEEMREDGAEEGREMGSEWNEGYSMD
ncbi:hypothetical protein LTR78_008178 [Recurvomyces mirabilis]|uniref:Uncharacterized protein n=1 Tax=Recurvomyces mirabilis TaxID=574656 RepID=A0AAE0TTJ7_9PEZI|nr:hypothetical protein LTR78_008178 [Recurvomyces mirabilis]KAK5150623.1 hypothetical protein LTS14_009906 [Recurvomyces mirabilis]